MDFPKISLGSYEISRLIAGGNPLSGFSHISSEMDGQMVSYYTSSRIKSFLRECEEQGINTLQARGDKHIIRILKEYWDQGGRIQWIAQIASELKDLRANINQIAKTGAVAVFHHGTYTDNLWLEGARGKKEILNNLKMMRDSGLVTGLGTHKPEVIRYSEEKGWEIDFYMLSWYNLAKGKKSVQAVDNFEQEEFNDADYEAMVPEILGTDKTCLVFKILGAGRKVGNVRKLGVAFESAFTNIKPCDAVVVGMYQKSHNQVRENSLLVRKILKKS